MMILFLSMLLGQGLEQSHFINSIPATWIIVQDQMSKFGLSLHHTDQSHLPSGQCSISHVLLLAKLSAPLAEHPTRHAIWSLHSMGFCLLSHIGGWTMSDLNLTSFTVMALLPGNWSLVQKRNWHMIKNYLSQAQIGAFYSSPANLLLSQSIRWQQAEKFIQSIMLANHFLPAKVSQGKQL